MTEDPSSNGRLRRDIYKAAGKGLGAGALTAIAMQAEAQTGTVKSGSRDFNVREYGAAGDGKSIDTPAVNRAIEAAAAAGGGTVRFPAGTYACFSIRLKSNITLALETGATILAAEGAEYDYAEPNGEWEPYQDFGHNHWHNSLIWGEGLNNIAILGPGLIWGKGLSKGYGPGPKAEQQGVGNKAIALKNCRSVLLRDFAILKGGHFGILATGVDNLIVDNLTIDTDRDGMDIDCCRNVRVSNCSVNSPWDDGICLKSSYGLGEPRSTDMVTITNCLVAGSFQLGALLDASFRKFAPDFRVPRTGRIKFGTESNGGFRNITISNCTFDGCQGLALETVDGALLEDVAITNITMRDVTSAPIFLRLGRRMRGPHGRAIGTLKRILISNLVSSNSASKISSILSGIPEHSIEDVKIDNLYLQSRGGGTKQMAALEPEEQETKYPEPGQFGPMPSTGFYIRHVKNMEMSNVEITTLESDARPAFVLADVTDADFFRIKAPQESGVSMFSLNRVERFSAARCRGVADVQLDRVERKTV